MQAYDQAVVSASKIISQAITSDLNCVIDNGLELDDLIISKPWKQYHPYAFHRFTLNRAGTR